MSHLLARRVVALLVVALCAPWTGCRETKPARPTEHKGQDLFRFASGHQAEGIPFEEDDGHVFLQLRVNGSAPLWFALDTGATRTIIEQGRAGALGLPSTDTRAIEGAGGSEDATIYEHASIELPGVELRDQTLWALPLDALSLANGREIAGIIGYDLFRHFVVDLDFVTRRMNLYDPRHYDYRGAGERVPLLVQEDGAIYARVKVAAPTREPVEGEFVIDTGSNASLMLARPFVEENRLLDGVAPTISARGRGVGGFTEITIGRVDRVELGTFVIRHTVAAFTRTGEIADPGKAGNIGGRILRRFHIIFDYGGRQMILEPNELFSEPEEWDMSGAALTSEPPAFNVIKVFRVRPDSPAAHAGLLADDVITAVDGDPVTDVAKLRRMFRQDGREYRLRLDRGGQTLEVAIKLARVI